MFTNFEYITFFSCPTERNIFYKRFISIKPLWLEIIEKKGCTESVRVIKGEQKKTSFSKKNRYFSIFCFTITTTLYITIFTRSLPWQLAGLSFWSEPAVLQQLSQSVSHIDPQFWPFEPMTSLWKFSVPPLFVDLWPWLLLLKMPRHFL